MADDVFEFIMTQPRSETFVHGDVCDGDNSSKHRCSEKQLPACMMQRTMESRVIIFFQNSWTSSLVSVLFTKLLTKFIIVLYLIEIESSSDIFVSIISCFNRNALV